MNIHDLFTRTKRAWSAPARRRGILALISGLLAALGVASYFLTSPAVLTDTLWLGGCCRITGRCYKFRHVILTKALASSSSISEIQKQKKGFCISDASA